MLNLGKLREVIKKEFLTLIRSRFSSLIVIIGPLLIVFMVGLAFDTSGYHNIKLAVYSDEYSELTESYIDALSDNAYRVFKLSSQEECIQAVRSGTHHACIIFSPDLRVEADSNSSIDIYIDNSQLNLAGLIQDAIFKKISNRTTELSQSLSQKLLDVFEDINDELTIRKKSIIALTTQNDELITTTNSIISSSQGMTVDFDISDFKVLELSSAISSASRSFSQYGEIIDDSVSDLMSSLEEIESEASSLNINESYKSALYSAIDSAKELASNISNEDSFELVQSNIASLSSYVSSIENQLESLASEISSMNEARNKLISQTQAMKQTLVNQLSKIMEIQAGINAIEDMIADIEIKDSELISQPIKTTVSPVLVNETHLSYLFPNLLVLIVMFVSLLLSSTLVQMERNSKAHFRNLIIPSNKTVFSLGTFLVTLLLVLIQIMIILSITALVFKTAIFSNLHFILLISALSSSFFILLGIIIANLFRSEETSLMAALVVGLILLLLSGTLIPLESMPQNIRKVTEFSPFVLTYNTYRDMILFKSTFSTISSELGYMTLFLLILASLVFFMQGLFERLSLNLHIRRHVPFKVAGKEIQGRKKLKSVFVKESKQMVYLRSLVDDCNNLLSKPHLTASDIAKAKKMYINMLNIYDSLPLSERKKIFPELNEIYKKINQ
ncbi:MAG: type transport system permease protein [Candidatus Woesearchaeota archaeon]|nr:type transport system permease protein [Candidatus Woesearchaeota archaeon]